MWNIWGRCVSCLEAAKIPSACLSLGAVAWHCRIRVGMGLRSRSKCRCDALGDHLQFSAGFRNFWAHSRDWICLAGTGKLLSFEGAPSSFLLFIATLLGPWVLKLWNFLVSEFKSRVASALANRGQRLVVQPELTCPLWKASAQKNVGNITFFGFFICPLNLCPLCKVDFFLIQDPSCRSLSWFKAALTGALVIEFPLGLKLHHGASLLSHFGLEF